MVVPATLTGLLAVILALAFGIIVGSSEDNHAGAILCLLACITVYSISILFIFQYGEIKKYEGMKEATIQCQTEDCPYYLKTKKDSTRQWVPRKDAE